MTRRATALVAVVVAVVTAVAFVVAVRSPGGRSHRASAAAPVRPDVGVARTALGRILVNDRGHTLYLFAADHGGRSTCSGSCARVWPPAIVTHATRPGAGIDAAKLSTTRRADSSLQLVYNGHPLYTLRADTRPGQTQGQGFLGTWFVLTPTGHPVGHPQRSAGY